MKDEVSGSASVTMARGMEKASSEFVLENYSVRRKGIGVSKAIESDEFVVGGHRWTICFYPDGVDVAAYDAGHASLYICLRGESRQPVEFLSSLYILDQSGKDLDCGLSAYESRSVYRSVQSLRSGRMTGCFCFIDVASLESPDKGYLKDDCLKIRATIGVFSCHIRADLAKLLGSKQWDWDDDEYVFFKVADERLCAGKSILAASCPALLSRLSVVGELKDIVIPDLESEVFKAVLWFIYRGTLHKQDEEAVHGSNPLDLTSFAAKMLAAADQFELKRLKEICESHILEKVSGESVGYLLHLADACHAAELKSACLRFAAKNHATIMESAGCEYLKQTCPVLFLDSAGFKDNNPSTSRKGALNWCNKVLSIYKESLAGRCLTWYAAYEKLKTKEV